MLQQGSDCCEPHLVQQWSQYSEVICGGQLVNRPHNSISVEYNYSNNLTRSEIGK